MYANDKISLGIDTKKKRVNRWVLSKKVEPHPITLRLI